MQLPSSEKNYTPTLANIAMIGSITTTVKKLGAATTVVNKATWSATVRRTDLHLEEENVGNRGQARHGATSAERVRDSLDPAPSAENGPRRPKKHLRKPGGGPPREELNSAISANKPENNLTLGNVTVEGTESEDASLFTVRGRICARRDDSCHSSVELLVDCGATSDFMSMQTAKRARLPLYKLTIPGHVLTAGGVQAKVRSYTRAYVQVGELVFRHYFKVLEILPNVVLVLPWLRGIIQLSTGRNGMPTYGMVRVDTDCLSTSQGIPPSCSSKPL